MEPKRRTQKERRLGTIRKLLDAATATLIEVGYAEASVQRICARAELSQGALFRHFATREALMVAVGEDVGDRLLERYRKKLLAVPAGDATLGTAVRLVRDACRSRLNHAWYELSVAARTNPNLRKHLEPVAQRYYEDIALAARELLPDFAAQLGSSFDAVVSTVIAVFDGEAVERFAVVRPEIEEARLALVIAAVEHLAAEAKRIARRVSPPNVKVTPRIGVLDTVAATALRNASLAKASRCAGEKSSSRFSSSVHRDRTS